MCPLLQRVRKSSPTDWRERLLRLSGKRACFRNKPQDNGAVFGGTTWLVFFKGGLKTTRRTRQQTIGWEISILTHDCGGFNGATETEREVVAEGGLRPNFFRIGLPFDDDPEVRRIRIQELSNAGKLIASLRPDLNAR